MNRKLHNSVTALVATSGLLVLSLMAANPIRSHLRGADVAPAAPAVSATGERGVTSAGGALQPAATVTAAQRSAPASECEPVVVNGPCRPCSR